MNRFVATASLAAALVITTGSAQAGGHVNWSIGINLPPIGAVVSSAAQYPYRSYEVPVYSSGYGPEYGAVVVPAPVYVAPPPVVVYRPAPPPVFYPRYRGYAPLPIAYGARWHDGHGWRDGRWSDRGGDSRDGRWAPVPRDERRQRH